MRILPLVGLSALAAACTWVEPKPEAAHISVEPLSDVQHCDRLGETTSKGVSKVGIFVRKDEKVMDELAALAKDSAFNMGGNRLVRESELKSDGSMTFGIYRCP
ncbi:DUF4156 domain-containing protein [Simiduia sp. 21SJ11W-1]|uniref:DUF4156 domain-containing protein n=1 Tax=Simiduia sp. 21SJ11W-1 TaxID=2909669 RepID=UPI00209DBA50|nr:DUF4156 domain-containing protein [Simiduia sp. 21SJ11W-1]UTA47803.1 DUF4156 domain-containing protein [Simiduia sp. 21SJ11W-1]